jgi:hypothetical protein
MTELKRRKEHGHEAEHTGDHACLAEFLAARTPDEMADQQLKSAGDENQAGQASRNLLSVVGKLANQVEYGSDIHYCNPLSCMQAESSSN